MNVQQQGTSSTQLTPLISGMYQL